MPPKAPSPPKDPFYLNNGVVKDKDGVKVWRKKEKTAVVYYKRFYDKNSYWQQREGRFITYCETQQMKHVAGLMRLDKTDSGNYKEIKTKDAGITINDWINVKNQQGEHPFYLVDEFLKLTKACLVALKELYYNEIVHCDIKADNICLPYIKTDTNVVYSWLDAKNINVDYENIKIIDFAYSICHDKKLELKQSLFHADNYLGALAQSAILSKDCSLQQKLDWRTDLYSLGYMLERVAFDASDTNIEQNIKKIIDKLKNEDANVDKPTHDIIIKEIDDLIKKSDDVVFDVADIGLREEINMNKIVIPTILLLLLSGMYLLFINDESKGFFILVALFFAFIIEYFLGKFLKNKRSSESVISLCMLMIVASGLCLHWYFDKTIEQNMGLYQQAQTTPPAPIVLSPQNPITQLMHRVKNSKAIQDTVFVYRIKQKEIYALLESWKNRDVALQKEGNTSANIEREQLAINANKTSGGVADNRPIGTHFYKEGVPPRYVMPYETKVDNDALNIKEQQPKIRTENEIRRDVNELGVKFWSVSERYKRQNVAVEGTIRLKLEIASSGSVVICEVASSDLHNEQFEEEIRSLVKSMKFEQGNFKVWTGTYPISFSR